MIENFVIGLLRPRGTFYPCGLTDLDSGGRFVIKACHLKRACRLWKRNPYFILWTGRRLQSVVEQMVVLVNPQKIFASNTNLLIESLDSKEESAQKYINVIKLAKPVYSVLNKSYTRFCYEKAEGSAQVATQAPREGGEYGDREVYFDSCVPLLSLNDYSCELCLIREIMTSESLGSGYINTWDMGSYSPQELAGELQINIRDRKDIQVHVDHILKKKNKIEYETFVFVV